MKWEELNNLIKLTVRRLRRDQTESEAILWKAVRNRKLLGKKFLRQHPIVFEWHGKKRFLIADFYCHEARLIVELDGAVHTKQKDYDRFRDYLLKSLGMKVVRFDNNRIKNDLDGVLRELKEELNSGFCSFKERKRQGFGFMGVSFLKKLHYCPLS